MAMSDTQIDSINTSSSQDSFRVISADDKQKKNLLSEVVDYITWLYRERRLINILTYIELRQTVVQTKLTYLWWLLDPLLNFICYFFLVTVLGRAGGTEVPYALFMLTGILTWHFVVKCMNDSAKIWERYSSLIGQMRFPYMVLIFSSVGYQFILYLFSQIIIFSICAIYGYYPTLTWFYLPLILGLQALLITGFMLLNSLIAFTFYDYQKLLPFLLRFWFFLSPVIWPISMIPAQYHSYIYWNPIAIILDCYRKTLLYHQAPAWSHIEALLMVIFVTLSISFILFIRREPYINRYV